MAKKKKGLTSNDIEKVQIYLISNDGRVFVGVADEITKQFIVGTTTFIEVNPDHIIELDTKDVVKK